MRRMQSPNPIFSQCDYIENPVFRRLLKKYYDYVSIEKQAVKNSFLEITHSKRLQNWKHRLMLFSILQGAFIMAAILLGFL